MQGKVKWFNQEKGFGFIVGSDNKEYFVHYTQIQIAGFKTLDEGCLVEFDPIEIEKGLQAKNVVVNIKYFLGLGLQIVKSGR